MELDTYGFVTGRSPVRSRRVAPLLHWFTSSPKKTDLVRSCSNPFGGSRKAVLPPARQPQSEHSPELSLGSAEGYGPVSVRELRLRVPRVLRLRAEQRGARPTQDLEVHPARLGGVQEVPFWVTLGNIHQQNRLSGTFPSY